jgi:imidazolonepropionase-like amidohydrolase
MRAHAALRGITIVWTLAVASAVSAESVAYRSGRWFDGERFVARTMYSVDGVLRQAAPPVVDRTIHLDGRFVLPPFAEAHNHWLEPDSVADYNARSLADGVFYVMDQATMPLLATRVRAATNRPNAVDYRAALLGFTGPGGHPMQIVRQFIKFGILPAAWESEEALDRNALLLVSNDKDIADRWPLLQKAHTDFVKVFLLYSDEYETRLTNPEVGYERGMDPRLVPSIVGRAHADGLRVSAHVYSAADFRNAVAGGVDLIAHMPGTGWSAGADAARFRITEDDARNASRGRIAVITTMSWVDDLRAESPADADFVLREVLIPNLRLLREHRVPMLIGSDQFRGTPLGELFLLQRTGLFTNAEILRIATRDTPRAIFPERVLGEFDEGAEASFLVLGADPLAHLGNIRTILLRVKRGAIVPSQNR